MTLVEKRVTEVGRILPMGQIEISEFIEVWKNGKLLVRSLPHNSVIEPDQEYTGDDELLKRHIAVEHTPKRKAAFIKYRKGQEEERKEALVANRKAIRDARLAVRTANNEVTTGE